jgi:hypothetical protein
LSGWIQVNFGFRPAFLGTILFYAISVFLYWYFFLHGKTRLFGQVRQKAELSA